MKKNKEMEKLSKDLGVNPQDLMKELDKLRKKGKEMDDLKKKTNGKNPDEMVKENDKLKD